MLSVGLALVMVSSPWTCPTSVCGPPPPPPPVESVATHARQFRSIMRALPRLRGRAPRFMTSEGERLSPSMSVSAIDRRLVRGDGLLWVQYGRCASHSTRCPWASLWIDLDATDPPLGPDVARRADLPSHTVFHASRDDAFEQAWVVWIQPQDDPTIAATIEIDGVLGLDRAALGALPIRRITAALRDAHAA